MAVYHHGYCITSWLAKEVKQMSSRPEPNTHGGFQGFTEYYWIRFFWHGNLVSMTADTYVKNAFRKTTAISSLLPRSE